MLRQALEPEVKIFTCGDLVTFTLEGDNIGNGEAFLRTNIGRISVRYDEIINQHEQQITPADRDWHDCPMQRINQRRFSLTLPLIEIGSFAAKIWFQATGSTTVQWSDGDNITLKVEPTNNICGNSIYTLFVRQFGANIAGKMATDNIEQTIEPFEQQGYAVIPPSGTFRNVIDKLPFIIQQLKCNIIQLLPIHPVPTTYARMGRFGSPFAVLDYFGVDPALAEFDERTTPFEQFIELVDAIHSYNGRIMLDIPVNHTGWASIVQQKHPEWFVRNAAGDFESPGAWGVIWADLCKLDYSQPQVCHFMAEVFLFWCRNGVDGFRCDAGYMVPQSAWNYICAKVKREFPETIFMLEGLGGMKSIQQKLLAESGLNWAYSELFQNYSRQQIEDYLPEALSSSFNDGILVNFAETHDNSRLAAVSSEYAKLRTALCALLAVNGTFGFSNGVEWLATEQIDVHQAKSLNWGSQHNQCLHLKKLNLLLILHPAFHARSEIEVLKTAATGEIITVYRRAVTNSTAFSQSPKPVACDLRVQKADINQPQTIKLSDNVKQNQKTLPVANSARVVIVANLAHNEPGVALCPANIFPDISELYDLLSGKTIAVTAEHGYYAIELEPLQLLLLSSEYHYHTELTAAVNNDNACEAPVILKQRIQHEMLKLLTIADALQDVTNLDLESLAENFITDPMQFCMEIFKLPLPPLTTWQDGYDQRRVVMVPPDNMLFITAPVPFRATIKHGKAAIATGRSLPQRDGTHFLILSCGEVRTETVERRLEMCCYDAPQHLRHSVGQLMLLGRQQNSALSLSWNATELQTHSLMTLAVNQLGGMSQMPAAWGTVNSKYDAILAANCHPDYPIDRQVMFTACRGWLVRQDYSLPLSLDYLHKFSTLPDGTAEWQFIINAGQGKAIELSITREMATADNCIKLNFKRRAVENNSPTLLPNDEPVKIILRPDLEDRCNHTVTKAFTGPEHSFPAAVNPTVAGFTFNPSGERQLQLTMSAAKFIEEPEWQYMVELPLETERGLEDRTDLFSPGYFEFELTGGATEQLVATIVSGTDIKNSDQLIPKFPSNKQVITEQVNFTTLLQQAMRQFIVKRDELKTVIAGYPWFLDWGRDTLICLRGMIAAGHIATSQDIIQQFACYEDHGTIPNMIRGNDDSNRDTSDAPLWLFTAVNDFMVQVGNDDIMQLDCHGRTLLEVLESIATGYRDGTANGIKMDPTSALIYSPAHFTWMDTNYPAATPRQGYPIEIAALWFAALKLLSRYHPQWLPLKKQVKQSIIDCFWHQNEQYFSDCLHASSAVPAKQATPDDACRPNQLFTITLGAVTDPKIIARVIRNCEPLLIPGAIRSLAPNRLNCPLPVYHQNQLLNDPHNPYWGHYCGDEDTRRKPAYHNGTAWVWQFPTYCEAMLKLDHQKYAKQAQSLLFAAHDLLATAIPGQLPEIVDGDLPHQWRGCPAQAWSITEFYRLTQLITARCAPQTQ
jgi:predicted glycogen debranching enzyme